MQFAEDLHKMTLFCSCHHRQLDGLDDVEQRVLEGLYWVVRHEWYECIKAYGFDFCDRFTNPFLKFFFIRGG